MTIAGPGAEAIAAWLIEVYALATLVLAGAGLALLGSKQPARRLAVARAALVGLAGLGPLVAACRWARSAPTAVAPCCRAGVPGAPALVLAFGAGSALSVGWLALGSVASARLRRRSRAAPDRLGAILARVAGGGASRPALLVGDGVAQPVALGVIRPAIVLPGRFADGEPEGRVELALAHEWAHLAHGDLRSLALARLLLPLYFAHPLFAWIRGRIGADQEALADLAASRRVGRIAYAQALLGWAASGRAVGRGGPAPTLGLGSRPPALRRRIALLLDLEGRVEAGCSRAWRIGVAAALASGLVGLALASLGGTIAGAVEVRRPHAHPPARARPIVPESPFDPATLCCPAEPRPGP